MPGIWQQLASRLAGGEVAAGGAEARTGNYGAMAAAVPPVTAAGGVWVTEESALQITAVLACVRILSGTLAGLPLHVYRRVGDGKERADKTPLARVLEQPNTWQTGYKWRETMWAWVLLYGNATNRIVRNGRGEAVGLLPMEPWHVTFLEHADAPELVYRYWNPTTRTTENYGAWEVLHLRGLTSDGRIGWGVIENLMREAVGLALTLQETATGFYENGSTLSGVITPGAKVTPATRQAFLDAWNTMHQGPANAGRVALLDFNDKYTPITVPPEQAQFLESRQYSVLEIARAFGVPPHLIGAPDSQSYASAEQNNLEFVQYTLLPWVRNLEDEIWRSLILEEQRGRLFAEHNLKGLLRGDTKARYEAYSIAIQNGWMNRNEVRDLEGLNKEEGLDEFLAPLNMTTAPALAAEAEETVKNPGAQAAPTQGADNGGDGADAAAKTTKAPTPAARKWAAADLVSIAPEFRFEWGEGHEERAAPDDEEDGDAVDSALSEEQTAARKDRQALFGTFFDLWEDSAARLVKREIADLRRKLGSLGEGADAVALFREWIDEFYRELQPKVPQYFRPVLVASIKAAAKSVERETGHKAPKAEAFAEFVEAYLANLALAWVGSSQGQINQLLEEEGEPLAAVDGRISEWEEGRAAKTANGQSVDSVNAGTLATYALVGVAATTWAARGKSCKFCRAMHGKRVAVGQPFIADATLAVGDEVLRVHGTKKHPQLHRSCDCVIVAG